MYSGIRCSCETREGSFKIYDEYQAAAAAVLDHVPEGICPCRRTASRWDVAAGGGSLAVK
jgi:hypothetical protein